MCGRTFPSERGLTAHRRQKHFDDRNRQKEAEILKRSQTHKPRKFWTDDEYLRLARHLHGLSWSERNERIRDLLPLFPGRNLNSLDRACYAPNYNKAVEMVTRERAVDLR